MRIPRPREYRLLRGRLTVGSGKPLRPPALAVTQ